MKQIRHQKTYNRVQIYSCQQSGDRIRHNSLTHTIKNRRERNKGVDSTKACRCENHRQKLNIKTNK